MGLKRGFEWWIHVEGWDDRREHNRDIDFLT